MKKGTFNLAVGRLSRAVSSFALETRVLSVSDAHIVIDAEMSFWLLTLTKRNLELLDLKRDQFIETQINNLKSKLSDQGVEFNSAADPFAALVDKKAITAGEAVGSFGHNAKCIDVAVLPEMIITVVRYEFFKKLRAKAPEMFIEPEAAMTEYSRKHKLALRLTSNAFLTDEEKAKRGSKEKREANFDVLKTFTCDADSIVY